MTEESGGSGSVFARYIRPHLPQKPWQLALIGLFGLAAAGVIVLAIVALALMPTLPSPDDLADKRLKVPMRVYTADGELLAEFGEEKRIPVKIDDVPDMQIKAILAAEDHSFFYHHGVDFLGIARAAFHNLRTNSTGQGASTITMQVARNYFLSPEKTFSRKFKEVLLAFKLERELSKKEILELYINKIFLGHRAYGFAAAAQVYFGKDLKDLTLPEMAMLAGLPKAPSRDNPLNSPDNALERRNYVLRHMQSLGYIDEPTLTAALAAPVTASKHAMHYEVEAPYIAEMVRQYMFQTYNEKTYAGGYNVYTTIDGKGQRAANTALRKWLLEYDRRHGWRGAAGHISLHGGEQDRDRLDEALNDYHAPDPLVPGVVINTEEKAATVYTQNGETVTVPWQGLAWARRYVDENNVGPAPARATDVLHTGDIVYVEQVETADTEDAKDAEEFKPYWRLGQMPAAEAAVVALRPSDGAILALSGGFDFFQSKFNRVTQAERQPGSNLKPFVYAAALSEGFTPATTVSGAPIVIEDTTVEDEWRPEDYTKKFFGPTRLRKALALSLNLVSVRLLRAAGTNYTADFLQRFGFAPDQLPRNLSLALGTASATPLQMATAYAVFANGGYKIEPYFIARIEDADHKVLEQANPAVVCVDCDKPKAMPVAVTADAKTEPAPRYAEQVLDPKIAFLITSMLQDTVRYGTAQRAKDLGRNDLSGKTGTTNDYRDAWFSGFNRDIVATAWLGFDQPASLGRAETGARAALPIWKDYMRVALDGLPDKPPVPPEGIVQELINKDTGLPTDATDPDSMEEYFVKGTENRTQGPVQVGENATETPPATPPLPTGDTAVAKPPENIREKLF
jgi:penicillin-binding protein 1A